MTSIELSTAPLEYALASPDELLATAWSAMVARDWDAALRRWAEMREYFPERWEGHIWPIQALWLAGRLDEATALAAAAQDFFADNPELLKLRA